MAHFSTVDMMQNMVPISRFNKGEATKIFNEVRVSGAKIVVKNNQPACVLLSPEQYEALMDMLSDYLLLSEANRRMSVNNEAENVSQDEVLRSFGLTEEDLEDVEVEIE